DDPAAFFAAGSCDDPCGAWHLVMHRVVHDGIPMSDGIRQAFQAIWVERKNMALSIDDPRLLRRALRFLLPPYSGPAVELYRGGTLHGWRRGVSWTASIEVARKFYLPDVIPGAVIVKTPAAIICRIEYPEPLTAAELAELGDVHEIDFHAEQEFVVDAELLTRFEILETGRDRSR
ncbi:MAG TPA: hypothetical protein VGJ20_30385, partial [Xanthobacteraceae bacterium]